MDPDDQPKRYVLIERERLERLMDAAMMAADEGDLFSVHLEPGDLDPIDDAHVDPPPAG